jgi:hypothetical protein
VDNLEILCDTFEEIKVRIIKKKHAGCHLTLALSWTSNVKEGNSHIGIVTGGARIVKVGFEVVDIFISEFEGSLILGWLDEVGALPSLAQNDKVAAIYMGKVGKGLRRDMNS